MKRLGWPTCDHEGEANIHNAGRFSLSVTLINNQLRVFAFKL
ncbi:hypothetical protein BN439_pEA290025 (plasmid) [Erwinia amylovora Ea644]|nr:hypothetical protein BN439_pEA290025 [Erwinia amylovora Ea644]